MLPNHKHCKTFIIAEAGVNHNGNVELAIKMIEVAATCGVDAIKFQTFLANKLVVRQAPKALYQIENSSKDESQFEMLEKLALSPVQHKKLIKECQRKKIEFISSPFDLESIDILVDLGLEIFKIPSGEITNLPYLRKIGGLKKQLIMSTGMSNMKDIEDALGIILTAGTIETNITLLHCNSEYPSPYEDVNLKAINTIEKKFGLRVGYSDHTIGIEIPVAAIAMGATVIEKHFTLDKNLKGPDHKASVNPDELKDMVVAIRKTEQALGNGVKIVSKSEFKNKAVARKSIVAAVKINKGEVFTEDNLTTKRPGSGLSPMLWDKVIGTIANKNYNPDDLI